MSSTTSFVKVRSGNLVAASWLSLLFAIAVLPTRSSAFDERAILVEFFQTTSGDQWLKKDNWGTDQPICSWQGVSCIGGSQTGDSEVDSIQLPENNIAGTIPASLYSLPLLRFLDLEGNPLTNAGFDGFAQAAADTGMSPLETLALNGCNLRDVTGIGNAPNSLRDLRLADNNLRGSFPAEIFTLTNLKRLFLDNNGITGAIPKSIGDMVSLVDFHAIGVPFQGSIPSEFGQLDRMVTLVLRDNEFTGQIPSEVNNMVNLEILSIGRSPEAGQGKLTGTLPSFSKLPYLELLDLSLNKLNGTIPRDFFLGNQRTDELVIVRLDGNELTGTLPKQLGWIDSMDLGLSGNKLVGPIPSELCNKKQWMTGLVEQFACDAILCPAGTSSEEGRHTQTSECKPCTGSAASSPLLGQTKCIGAPPSVGAWRVLPEFYQALQGESWSNRDGWSTIDALLQNKKLTDIQSTDLDYCSFYGVTCSSSDDVLKIELKDNHLFGVVPSSVFTLSSMTTFDISSNRVSLDQEAFGRIADTNSLSRLVLSHTDVNSWGGLENALSIIELYLDGNSFESELPESLFSLSNLEVLECPNSQIQGSIPTLVGRLKSLKRLELRWNSLSGVLPSEFGLLTNLEKLGLAYNDFEGMLPPELNSLSNLKELQLSRAHRGGLDGQLPALDGLSALQVLGLSHNSFQGDIPSTFLSGVADKGKAMKVSLSYNRLKGVVPKHLDDFSSMVLELEGNMIEDLPSVFCDNTFWMEGYVEKASYGCNAILCPPQTYNQNGKESQSALCTPCEDNQYYGMTECGGDTATDGSSNGGSTEGSLGFLPTNPEVAILDKLFQATNGNEWTETHDNWTKPGVSICNREGVSCNGDGKVDALRLNRFGLTGTIPTEIYKLDSVRALGFTDNNIDLKFDGIEKCISLETLLLSNTKIKALTGLENAPQSLRSIHLARNDLTGTFPASLSRLNNLHKIFLNQNRLSSTIPAEIASLSSLEELHMWDNRITGQLPAEIGALTMLEVLNLKQNLLSGPIPAEFAKLSSLEQIDLSDQRGNDKLSGPLFPFSANSKLRNLNVSMNAFAGTIPADLLGSSNKTKEIIIDLSQNRLSGGVPVQFSNFQKLDLYLAGNMITDLPSSLCNSGSWMEGDVAIVGSCDAILCSPGSFSQIGRANATDDCMPCNTGATASYYGSMGCSNTAQTSERDILISFYRGLNGDKWLNSFNWGSESGICTWFGVTCNDDLSVVELKLASNQIVSSPDQLDVVSLIFELPNLEVLDLKGNALHIDFQRIPSTSSLQSLRVSGTGLTSLAGISRAKHLIRLHATDNLLNGTLPDEIFDLSDLKSLYLSFNSFEGQLSPKISQLENLEELYMYGNLLSKTLPTEMGSLQTLREVVLARNFLTGSIPTQFSSLPKLEQLSLYDQQGTNVISGSLPSFAQAPNLWFLDLSDCALSGTIPDNFMANSVHADETVTLLLTNNEITGTIPPSLKQFNSLDINLAGNKIEGISKDLCGKSDWMKGELGLVGSCDGILCPPGSYNEYGRQKADTPCMNCDDLTGVPYFGQTLCQSFEGERGALNLLYQSTGGDFWEAKSKWTTQSPICSWEGIDCSNGSEEDDEGVTAIKLEKNKLSGSLPTAIWSLPSLQTLLLSGNEELSISFDGLSNAQSLEVLQISSTRIKSISGISQAAQLKEFFSDGNGLTGTLPGEIFDMHATLEKVRLSANFFYGDLPTDISKMTRLVEFHLASNEFYSTIPDEITQLQLMQSIALNENLFYGELPSGLSSMPNLQIFSVRRERKSGPKLSGSIPAFDKNPNLTVLFLDGNLFSGTIPDNFLASSESVYLVDLKNNSLSGTVPESLGSLTELDIRLEGNQISSLPAHFCDNANWMGGNVGRLKTCDAIMCPPGTASPTGRALSSPNECVSCAPPKAAPYYGSRTCDPVLSEKEILVKLYDATNGGEWRNSQNWNSNVDICDWHGVGCKEGHVILINLGANNLRGTPPAELFDLPRLEILWLNSNPLEFTFAHIGRATNLMDLRVDETSLTTLAGVGEAVFLTSLHIGFNPIGGPFPTELLQLTNIRTLTMNNNGFTGTIPDLSTLKYLRTLRLNDNNFSGPMPTLEGMYILNTIDLSNNKLTSTIPSTFLADLGLNVKPEIDLSSNNIQGSVPRELARFDVLSIFLRGNRINGIPGSLCSKSDWNDGEVGDYGCDAILCAPGTANFDGRHSSRSPGCTSCEEAADFFGQAACLSATLGQSSALSLRTGNFAVFMLTFVSGLFYIL